MPSIAPILDAALHTLACATANPYAEPSAEVYDENAPETLDGYDYPWSESAREHVKERLEAFLHDAAPHLRALEYLGLTLYADDPAAIGHDYALTCEHHGTGFWDRLTGAGIHPHSPLGSQIQYHLDTLTLLCERAGGMEAYADLEKKELDLL